MTGRVTEELACRMAAEFDQLILTDPITSCAATAFATAVLTGVMVVGMMSMLGSMRLAY